MSFVVREVRDPEDVPGVHKVWSWVYRLADPSTQEFEPPDAGDHWYLGEIDGEVATACAVYGYTVARGDVDLSCGGVGAVATLSEHRGKGYAEKFMGDVLRLMKDAGHHVTNLYAFRDPFYAKVGYGTCGWRWKIVCPAHRLPKKTNTMPVRQLAPEDVGQLSEVHTKFVRQMSGSPVRGAVEWRRRMGTKPPLVYAIGDPIEAYLWVRIKEFWGDVDVGEIAWSTPRGYDAIFSVLRNIGLNQKTFTFMEPPDSRFLAHCYDQGVEMSIYRQTMYRVLDLEGAVKRLKPKGEGELFFSVRDPHIAENDGAWRASWSGGPVQIEPSPRGDIAFSIAARQARPHRGSQPRRGRRRRTAFHTDASLLHGVLLS
jgi:predicted acetyltransferase